MPSEYINSYYNLESAAAVVGQGNHRGFVGGMWDEIGRLQFEFVRDDGLAPDMRLIDIGCGCLRGGVHFVQYLNPGHYCGIDISQDLLDAGYEVELAALGLQHKVPRENLICNSSFDERTFGVRFDIALAQSVFTHLPLNHMKLCMKRAAEYVKEGGALYATVFLSPPNHDWTEPARHPRGGIMFYPDQDPYHYEEADLRHCIAGLPWTLEKLVDWNHPRDQMMAVLRRTAN